MGSERVGVTTSSMDKWSRQSAEDVQKQIAWPMTVDRLSYTLKHKRGNLAMWPSGAQIIYQIEAVTFLNMTSCLAVCPPAPPQEQDDIQCCPQIAVKIKAQARKSRDDQSNILYTSHTHFIYSHNERCKGKEESKWDMHLILMHRMLLIPGLRPSLWQQKRNCKVKQKRAKKQRIVSVECWQ